MVERRLDFLAKRRRAAPKGASEDARPFDLQRQDQVLGHRQMRKHRIALEDDAAVGRRPPRQWLAGDADRRPASARSWLSSSRRKVDFPQPEAPTIVTNAPPDREIDALEDRGSRHRTRRRRSTSTKLTGSPLRDAPSGRADATGDRESGREHRRGA